MTKKTVADYPHLVAQWHPAKNGSLRPEDVTFGSRRKVWWLCPEGLDHEWEAAVCDRQRTGCSVCAGRTVVPSNCLVTTHPDLAAQWHPSRNGTLTPHDVSFGWGTKVWWLCPKAPDHEWVSTINNRSRGQGCPACKGRLVVPSNCLATTHPHIAAQWHPTRNMPLTPYTVTFGQAKRIWWVCDRGPDHDWAATINDRSWGQGCAVCEGRRVVASNCLATTYPDVAAQWHPTKNAPLSPYHVVKGSNRKVWWTCDKSHEWVSTISSRTKGVGCPRCYKSHGEDAIEKVLIDLGVYYQREFRFKNCKSIMSLPFDFAIVPDGRDVGLIEYQGEQHYLPIPNRGGVPRFTQIKLRDQIKKDFCENRKLPFLEIPYWEKDRIPRLLEDFLNSLPARRRLRK